MLFPGLDAGNHSNEARVDWTFDPGRFSIRVNDEVQAGEEVFNNYGPKSNGELLIGYGFCIPDNPYDTVALTPKEPPQDLQEDLKNVKADYFTAEGEWDSAKATFRLILPTTQLLYARQIFFELPEPLLELLLYMLWRERGLPFQSAANPLDRISFPHSSESRHLPHLARLIAQFLARKLAQLESVVLLSTPQTKKQQQAAIYRQGQIKIMRYYIHSLQDFIRSLVWVPLHLDPQLPSVPCLVTLKSLITVLGSRGTLDNWFVKGIEVNANTGDLEQLRMAGWEEDIWVLLWCYLGLSPGRGSEWLNGVLPEYINLAHALDPASTSSGDESVVQAASLLDTVHTAASHCPSSVWQDERWSAAYVANVGGRILEHESFTIDTSDSEGNEEPRLYVYLSAFERG